ncbi:heterokaryon incompatibility protein-domain-containing protein [Nemania sp. FL0031]|nr:heterokaryon incompatibility protein-domain-containing protein [Nemania sp. FL0031]
MDTIFRDSDDDSGREPQNENFAYSSGRLDSNEIRVLVLLPNLDPQAAIQCRLFRYSLESMNSYGLQTHPFMALSYVWGDTEPKKTVFIYGKPKIVTPNLHDALLQLRNPVLPILIWVDAICINQEDIQERSQQVRNMSEIYSKVARVICWLGKTHDTTEVAGDVPAARGLGNLEGFLQAKDADGNPRTLSGKQFGEINHYLFALCSLPFWYRIWITQEVVLSRKALFLWGDVIIDLATFQKLLKYKDRLMPVNWYWSFSVTRSAIMYANFKQPLEMRSRSLTLQEALLATRNRSATDPRDYVYGVLGLAQLGTTSIITDYTKSTKTVYLEAFKAILQQELNLDSLSVCGRGWRQTYKTEGAKSEENWPTWLPDWSHESLKVSLSEEMLDGNFGIGDRFKSVLLDCQEYDPIEFSASGDLEKSVHILSGDEQLRVRGIDFDSVEIELNASDENDWSEEVKSLWDRGSLRNTFHDLHALRYACMRTKRYGHRNSTSTGPDDNRTVPSFADDEYVLKETVSPTNTSVQSSFEPFDEIERYQSDLDTRRGITHTDRFLLGRCKSSYFITRRGYVGRAPMPIKVGDKICIFWGAKVPFLLRQQPFSESFTVVGEAYIHGIMKGAAMASMKDESKDFILV